MHEHTPQPPHTTTLMQSDYFLRHDDHMNSKVRVKVEPRATSHRDT